MVQGFVGDAPKTAWVIGYWLLERIHYLLVAGYDVYGNLGHQLNTRLYMDFLRMEGEFNFLTLLPEQVRKKERDHWYRGANENVKSFIYGRRFHFDQQSGIEYRTTDPKAELFDLLRKRLAPVLNHAHAIEQDSETAITGQLKRLSQLRGRVLSPLPETLFLTVTDSDKGKNQIYTLIHNTGRSNISHLFSNDQQLIPEEDTLTVTRGFIGAYPNAFFHITQSELPEFVTAIANLKNEDNYRALLSRFGVRRSDPDFWQHSDELHSLYQKTAPIEAALFDYNRLENR